jgi:hypothetical protein
MGQLADPSVGRFFAEFFAGPRVMLYTNSRAVAAGAANSAALRGVPEQCEKPR